MTNSDALLNARTSFEATLLTLSAQDEDAAVVVLTLARLAAEEISRNTEFASAAKAVSHSLTTTTVPASTTATPQAPVTTPTRRTRSVRTPAVLDPFQVLRADGADGLTTRLGALDLEQLRDIIHQYGMDPDKRAMKWKTISKVRERIVERALSTSSRDNAFR
ncbi:hypothetical protein CH289_17340 [Rhodococcus sp. RS1C4]|nr:hypothetical protein [Rhodococcus sp. RS1C4]OZC49300.1 hypothetical protein CH289_17340 [Rhodococcus sp. RS1C4]